MAIETKRLSAADIDFDSETDQDALLDQVIAAGNLQLAAELKRARDLGALDDFRRNLARVIYRAKMGGHSAPESVLLSIYERSMANLAVALQFPESGRRTLANLR